MVPTYPLGLLAPSTFYNLQEIPHSWTTPQVIPHTWDSLSDTSHLEFSSQRFTNEDRKYSHKILLQNFRHKCTRKIIIKWCTKDMQVLEQCALKNVLPRLKYIQEMFRKVKLLKQWRLEHFYRRKRPN